AKQEVDAAWYEFITRFEHLLFKSIRNTYRQNAPHLPLTTEDISDLIQQVFLKLSRNNHSVLRELKCHKQNSVRLYLYAAASNTAIDAIRAEQVKTFAFHQAYDEDDYASHPNLYAQEANAEEMFLMREQIEQVLAIVDEESNEETRERN